MRRINLPLILDTLFSALCAFLLFFTAIRYYTKSAYIALAFAICACLLFGSLCFLYLSRKQNKSLLISRDEKQKKLLSLHLSLSSDEYLCDLFEKSLSTSDATAEIKGGKVYFKDGVYFFDFKMQPLNEDDVARIIKFKCDEKKIIYCCKASAEAAVLAENFLIEIKQIDDVYPILKERGLLPEKYVYEGAKKISVWKKIRARFSRRICAPLFWSGAALLALSYLTFFPVYYIVSGSIMLILSAVALVFN
ncbi:MAG: hypothetical protein K2K60_04090 [Clostridia bacterium]|nr:hypothetical protein [Clostridia bacterium]